MFSRYYFYLPSNLSTRQSTTSGFSFIEVVVTVFIFSAAILPLIQLSITNTQAASKLKANVAAVHALKSLSQHIAINQHYVDTEGTPSGYFNELNYQLTRLGHCNKTLFQCYCLKTPSALTDCQLNTCSSEQLVMYDTYRVSCYLAQNIPDYNVKIKHDNETVEISILQNLPKRLLQATGSDSSSSVISSITLVVLE